MGLEGLARGWARAGQALGMRAISHTRTSKKLPDIEEVGLRELLERSDVFSICCPLTECTQASIAKEQLFWMKKGAILLNCASGRIVVEEDVLSALEQGQISYYLADVMAQEPPQKGKSPASPRKSNCDAAPCLGAAGNAPPSGQKLRFPMCGRIWKAGNKTACNRPI